MMKKVCTKCHKEWSDLADDDLFCPDCCGKLIVAPTGQHPSQQRGLQMDNSIHRGDNIAGNSLQAQSIDNRTVTTNSNTTINNYQNIVDETKRVCKCELSGKMVSIMDIVECPKCHRQVANQFYVDSHLMCVECFDKLRKNPLLDVSPQTPLAPVSAPEPTTPILEQPEVVNIPVIPIIDVVQPPTGSPRKSYNKIIWGIVALIVIGVAFVLVPKNKGGDYSDYAEATDSTSVIDEQSQPTSAPEKQVETANVANSQKSSTAIEKPKKVTEETAYVETGIETYNKGNYAKASLLLKNEAEQGNASSAYHLAIMYKEGKGVSKNANQAFTLMKQAAENGCADAYYELAEMYRLGLGTEANRANAKKWYEQAVINNGKNADLASQKLNIYR